MYSKIFELQAELLKSLAHPRRLEIVQLLRGQELNVTDIYEMLDLPQANISQHLMILRDMGVVNARRDGKQIFYALAHPKIIAGCDALREMLIDQHKGSGVEKALMLKMKDLVPIVHDPVCHMRVSPKTASDSFKYQGTHYYFCASGCTKKFKESPERFIRK